MKTNTTTETNTPIVCAPHARARGTTKLPKILMARVNRLAHKAALRYEEAQRANLLNQMRQATDQGKTLTELLVTLDRLENKQADANTMP